MKGEILRGEHAYKQMDSCSVGLLAYLIPSISLQKSYNLALVYVDSDLKRFHS